jgi:hypothetical protein
MSFSLSPGVTTRELDLSAVVGAAVSSLGAFAGKFHWGPVNQPRLIAGETDLVQTFGYPDNTNAADFFTMTSFYAYTSGAWVTRIGNSDMTNASYPTGEVTILNEDEFNEKSSTLLSTSILARYPGQVGNALDIAICSNKEQYEFTFTSESETPNSHEVVFEFDAGAGVGIKSKQIKYTYTTDDATSIISIGDVLVIDGTSYGITGIDETSIWLDRIYVGKAVPKEIKRYWKHYNLVDNAPNESEFHLVIIDNAGYFKQVGAVLEVYNNISIKVDAKDDQNITSYWENVLNRTSQYVYAGKASPVTGDSNVAVNVSLTGGNNSQATVGLDEYIKGYDFYSNAEIYNTPLIIAGEGITSNDPAGAVLANYLIDTLAEVRKDTVVFVSPPLSAVLNNKGREAQSTVEARKLLGSSSYATMDCNWKYMYDKYNDTFRWVPCSGDHAGLYAQNDRERDPWVSAAGTSKGRMKNVVKFAYNPDKPERDVLYSNDVNPMFVMAIVGPVLFGDKTLLGKNTALSRNNVRRLMIVLEKTISRAAVDMLFEFNDEYTQRRFVSMVEPFLKDAKGRRGLTSYKVIADETVNTPQVVQNNSFVGQIYIKPNYTISDIRLDFVVVNASATFEEVIGSY